MNDHSHSPDRSGVDDGRINQYLGRTDNGHVVSAPQYMVPGNPYASYPYAGYPYASYPYASYPYASYPYASYPYASYPYDGGAYARTSYLYAIYPYADGPYASASSPDANYPQVQDSYYTPKDLPTNICEGGGFLTEARGVFVSGLDHKCDLFQLNQLLVSLTNVQPVECKLHKDPR
jgi:hypothetical protein